MFPYINHALSPGFNGQPQTMPFINRTGATISKGAVVMLDVAGTATESTNDTDPGNSGWNQINVITATQAGVDAGWPTFVATEDVLDDAWGNFVICGLTQVLFADQDDSTTNVTVGGRLSMVITESATAVQGYPAGTSGRRTLGTGLEISNTSPASLKWAMWTGGLWNYGVSNTA